MPERIRDTNNQPEAKNGSPWEERRDILYKKLETKIGIVGGLWEDVLALDPPKAGDSAEKIQEEEQRLKRHLRRAERAFPHTLQQLAVYDTISSQLKNLQKSPTDIEIPEVEEEENFYVPDNLPEEDDLEDDLRSRLDELLEDKDFQFVLSLRNGINGALKKRALIRKTLAYLENKGEDPNNPEAYLEFCKKKRRQLLEGRIKRVLFGRFSISLSVDEQFFRETKKGVGAGYHLDGTIFNFLNYQRHKHEAEDLEDLLHIISHRHEDFHSFVDDFGLGDNLREFNIPKFSDRIENYLKRIDIFQAQEDKIYKILLKSQLKSLSDYLTRFIDYGHEEFLAEIAAMKSSKNRTFEIWPYFFLRDGTFPPRISEARSILENLRERNPIIEQRIKDFDIIEIWRRFMKMYNQIPRRKRDDFFAAFAIYPPSEWPKIERLVRKWGKESSR